MSSGIQYLRLQGLTVLGLDPELAVTRARSHWTIIISIDIYIYIYIHLYISLSLYIYIYISLCLSLSLYV